MSVCVCVSLWMEWSEKGSPRKVIFELRLEMSRSQLLEELGESFLGQHQSLRWEKTGYVWETRKRPVYFVIILFCSFLVLRNVKKRILWKLGKKCRYPTNNSAFSTYALTELTAIMNYKFWEM